MKPYLIYLPGMEGTGKLFYRQESLLAPYFQVRIIPSRSNPPFEYDQLTADVLSVINREEIDQATIVAESFGGTVALQFALQHPEHVKQLVLINTFPYFRRRFRLKLGLALLPLTFFPFGNAVREFFYKRTLGFEGIEKEDIEKLCECSFSHGYAASRNRMTLIRDLDVRNRLAEIEIPVTLIASARDKMLPSVKDAYEMSQRLPNARVIVLQKHGHTPLIAPDFSLVQVLHH